MTRKKTIPVKQQNRRQYSPRFKELAVVCEKAGVAQVALSRLCAISARKRLRQKKVAWR
jgi:hypothetical protein